MIFWNFAANGLCHWDEFYWVESALAFGGLGRGIFLFYDPGLFSLIVSIMFRMFGVHDYVAVATSGIAALLLCIVTFVWTRNTYDLTTAAVATTILTSTGFFLLFARMALADMVFTLFVSCTIFVYAQAIAKQKNSIYLMGGILLALATATKYYGFQALIVILVFLPIFAVSDSWKNGLHIHMLVTRASRRLARAISGLWLSAAPFFVFVLLFLAYIAEPFPYTDLNAFLAMMLNIPSRVAHGFIFLNDVVLPTKAMINNLQPFVTADFYLRVLLGSVAVPVLALAVVGGARGIVKRSVDDILLIIWFSTFFVYFSSLWPPYARVILPALVPIAILSARGTVSLAREIDKLGQVHFRTHRFGRVSKTILVISLIVTILPSSLSVVTNPHSGYRNAAEFILAHVPEGASVWIKTQEVLLTYLRLSEKNINVTFDDPSERAIDGIDHADFVVLDYLASVSSQYGRITSCISQMILIASFRNDMPMINFFDAPSLARMDFSKLQTLLSTDAGLMNIRIYAKPTLYSISQSQDSFTYARVNILGEVATDPKRQQEGRK